MNELFAGYANYASTEAILQERATTAAQPAEESSITVTISWTFSWTVTWTA
ncbi:hypothetical protein [Streptomyces sp. HPF1205]|uniref:hypothetical protein n=1 Tax=Streptomyces sp. HPF1205 TaxID=2873262 RepID=UPI001CEC1BA6|nr:hypothetical protein [Streptomyces sp. HPF1205]